MPSPTKWLPKGSVGEAIRRREGLDEACSSCDERVKNFRPEEACGRVEEARAEQALRIAAKAKATEEDEEEAESPPGMVYRQRTRL